jgi:hypothetical protein
MSKTLDELTRDAKRDIEAREEKDRREAEQLEQERARMHEQARNAYGRK